MAYIYPNSTIKFLTSVRLNSNRQDTIYFETLADQTNYFWNKAGVVYNDYYYVRQTGKVRVRVDPNGSQYRRLTSCVYMMFKNTSFENKWYYAFITKINEYVNNETMEISFEIDPIQSFMFEPDGSPCYVPLKCMVERQTPEVDYAPINRHHMTKESFDTGDYLFDDNPYGLDFVETGFQIQKNTSVLTSSGQVNTHMINWSSYAVSGTKYWYPVLFTTMDATGTQKSVNGTYVGGAYSGLNCYIFFQTSSVNDFINEVDASGKSDQLVSMSMWPLSLITELINQGPVESLSGNTITTIAGAIAAKAIKLTSVSTSGTMGRIVDKVMQIPRPIIKVVTGDEGYFELIFAAEQYVGYKSIKARNLKCFSSLFMGLFITNGQGTIETYDFEYWEDGSSGHPELEMFFSPTAAATAMLCPKKYRGNGRQFNIGLQSFPQCAFTNSTYRQWLARNTPLLAYEKTALEKQNDLSMLQAEHALTTARGAYTSSMEQAQLDAEKNLAKSNSVTGQIGTAFETLNLAIGLNARDETLSYGVEGLRSADLAAKQTDLAMAQAQRTRAGATRSYGEAQAEVNANKQLLNARQKAQKSVASMSANAYHGNTQVGAEVITGDMRFHVGFYYSPQEFVDKADAFFDMYGYEMNIIKKPNIAAGNYWTYVKTCGFSARNNAVPDEYMREIAALFDGGIRFWKNGEDIGNYRFGNNVYDIT